MRLWHVELLDALPKQMLVSQWRELSAIVGAINKNGTPNHRLVNYVLDYPKAHLFAYTLEVERVMHERNLKTSLQVHNKIIGYTGTDIVEIHEIYPEVHNVEYLKICYYNLKEKYLRGIISDSEWAILDMHYKYLVKDYEMAILHGNYNNGGGKNE